MAGKLILTHSKVRKLQRTLYQQAKKRPKWKAWSLYADLCRKEFIEEAMCRVLRNKGGSGVDGYKVETMKADWENFRDSLQQELKSKTFKASPVKRVSIPKGKGKFRQLGIPTVKDRVVQTILMLLIEPIFEADFHDRSYGYRPQKQAYDAVSEIGMHMHFGKTVAIEADLSSYFDTIDHNRLLRLIKRRVSDGSALALITQFLRVPIVEKTVKGKTVTHANIRRGVPQGGVISPMLANLYLDTLDKAVNSLDKGRVCMIRYADDFVILVKEGLEGVILERVKDWLSRAGLTLNMEKTKVTNIDTKGKVEFLGFELSKRLSLRGKEYIHRQPSKKSQAKFKENVRRDLSRWTEWKSPIEVVTHINRKTRGWGNYFHNGNSTTVFESMNVWLQQRMRRWLASKYKTGSRSMYKTYPESRLQDEFGLYVLPNTAAWRSSIVS